MYPYFPWLSSLVCNLMQFQHLSVANLKIPRAPTKRFVLQKAAQTQTSPTSSFCLSPQTQVSNHQPLVNFKSSSSQTTFLDRNIVDNLTLQLLRSPKEHSLILTKESFDEIEESLAGTVTTAAPSSIGGGVHGGRLRQESGQIKPNHMSATPHINNITASWSCSGASACGGSSAITKRASSISGNLPEGIS